MHRGFFFSNRHSNSLKSNERGATIVEFSIAGVLFFTVIFVALDFFIVSFQRVASQHVIAEVLRESSVLSSRGETRANIMKTNIINTLQIWGITVANSNITICSETNIATCTSGAAHAGGENQLVSVRINYTINSLISPRTYTIDVGAIGRNEPI